MRADTMSEFLGPADVAEALGVTLNRAYRLIQEGKIPATRVAGVIRIPRTAWVQWLNEQTEAALANCHDMEVRSLRR